MEVVEAGKEAIKAVGAANIANLAKNSKQAAAMDGNEAASPSGERMTSGHTSSADDAKLGSSSKTKQRCTASVARHLGHLK